MHRFVFNSVVCTHASTRITLAGQPWPATYFLTIIVMIVIISTSVVNITLDAF